MLRLGHKFALKNPLSVALEELIQAVDMKYGRMFKAISTREKDNWDMWIKAIRKKARRIKDQRLSKLHHLVLRGMQDLKNMDIVIKHSDKNLGIVAIRKNIYNVLLMKHLNSDGFIKVNTFPHGMILRRLTNILSVAGHIHSNQRDEWIIQAGEAQEPCPFYIIPKLHKAKLGTRPITAQHSYMLAPLSKKLANVLQVEVDMIPEIARDSKMVLQQLEDVRINEPCKIVTYDVEQLYPSIN